MICIRTNFPFANRNGETRRHITFTISELLHAIDRAKAFTFTQHIHIILLPFRPFSITSDPTQQQRIGVSHRRTVLIFCMNIAIFIFSSSTNSVWNCGRWWVYLTPFLSLLLLRSDCETLYREFSDWHAIWNWVLHQIYNEDYNGRKIKS